MTLLFWGNENVEFARTKAGIISLAKFVCRSPPMLDLNALPERVSVFEVYGFLKRLWTNPRRRLNFT